MSDHYSPIWISDAFIDPIWEDHQGPWWRRSMSTSYPNDGSRADHSWLRESESETDRELPEWCIPWSVIHERSTFVTETSNSGFSGDPATGHCALLNRLADYYWAERGWVLLSIIGLGEADLLTSCTEGDSKT